MGTSLVMLADSTASNVVDNVQTSVDVSTFIPVVKTSVEAVFDMGTSAFNFLFDNPLCGFIMGAGFAFTALGLVRKALRVSKRA